jgi:hypothetical protein
MQSASQRGMGAKVPRKTNAPDSRISLRKIGDELESAVFRMVVDYEPFPIHIDGLHRLAQPLIECRQILRFVERRGHNGQQTARWRRLML